MKIIICLALLMMLATTPVWSQKQSRDSQGTSMGVTNKKTTGSTNLLGTKKPKTDLNTKTQKSSTSNVLGASNPTKPKTPKNASITGPSKTKTPKQQLPKIN